MSGMNGHSNGKAKHPGGRPSKYDPAFCEQATKLCLLGATDEQIANFFEVDEATINRWKISHPEFCESLKDGKERADGAIAASLYHRAKGYSHEAVKIVADAKTGAEHIVPYTEHYPPDTTACIFWLKNRRSGQWRDRIENQHSGPDGGAIILRYENEDANRLAIMHDA